MEHTDNPHRPAKHDVGHGVHHHRHGRLQDLSLPDEAEYRMGCRCGIRVWFHHRKEVNLEKEEEQVQEQPKKSKMEELDEEAKKQGKKVSKTWEAMMRLKGSLIVNDPRFLL